MVRNNLAQAQQAAGRLEEAALALEENHELRVRKLGSSHPQTLHGRFNLAIAYERLNRWERAAALFRELVSRGAVPGGPDRGKALGHLGIALMKQNRWQEAVDLLRERLKILEAARRNDWSFYQARSQVGEALLGLHSFAKAEPLLVSGYEGMKARESAIPRDDKPSLNAAASRVIELYEAWGRPEEAMAWKVKLGLADLPANLFGDR